MSEKFDIPFESNLVPQMLDLGTRLKFRCHKGISCFNACCKKADITLNRKVLSEIAIHDPAGFTKVVETAKAKIA